IRSVWIVPVSAEIRLAIRKTGCGSCRGLIRSASRAASTTAAAPTTTCSTSTALSALSARRGLCAGPSSLSLSAMGYERKVKRYDGDEGRHCHDGIQTNSQVVSPFSIAGSPRYDSQRLCSTRSGVKIIEIWSLVGGHWSLLNDRFFIQQ